MDEFKRREFIKLSAFGFAGIALQLKSISSHAQIANAHFGKWNHDTKLNWDAFLEQITRLAKTQHQLPWDQTVYTEQVKQLLQQCNFPQFENVKKEMDAYENKNPNWFEAASLHKEIDFQVSLFQFEKGEYIPHHDHPDMTGVINVVSGNALAKNYTVEDQLTTTRKVTKHGRSEVMQQCTLREVGNESIRRGDVSILTAHEGNIHSIMPLEFTQLVDVFTPAYTRETKSIWYTVDEDGFYEGRDNMFKAEYVDTNSSEVSTIKLSRRKLNQCVGTYKVSDELFFTLIRADHDLFMERSKNLDATGKKMKLLPYDENKFWIEGQDIRCVVNFENSKSPQSITLYVAENEITANKMK